MLLEKTIERIAGRITTMTASALSVAGTLGVTGATTLTGGLVGADNARVQAVPGIILATTGTDVATAAAGDKYYVELIIRYNTTLTGAAILNGPTVGTDKWNLLLFNAAGALVASSALAGTTSSGADAWQQVAFTSTYAAVPGRYFVGIQGEGTTDNFHCYAAGGTASCGTDTADAFGTVTAITPPTTFTADVGPVMYVY